MRDASLAARTLIAVSTVGAVAAALVAPTTGDLVGGVPQWAVAALILACSVLSVEIGWIVEGRTRVEQRPHKALSVWAFAVVLAVAPAWLLVVVPLTYGHVYWRGLRPPWWKWVGSAAFVTLAAVAAAYTLDVGDVDLSVASDQQAFGPVLAAMLAFLAVESGLFFLVSRINRRDQELWLRRTLASPAFYLTEYGLLSVGALSVMLWSHSPWLGLLLVPVYGFVQQAVVFEPLRLEATTDGKTGLLRYEPWRAMCSYERDRMKRNGSPWAVLFVDLDHFSAFNEAHGHLGGDEALVQIAEVLKRNIRKPDLVCRFGGEEFAILLTDTSVEEASGVAERLRAAIAALPGPALTASVGVAATDSTTHGAAELSIALGSADRALYDAKRSGRNTVVVRSIKPQRVTA